VITAQRPAEVAGLLALAASRPQEGLARARVVLAGRPGPLEASIAHHAAGFVLREFGDLDAAIRELRAALRAARRAKSPGREANVLAALGVALVYAGQTGTGMAAFDQAAGLARGVDTARIQHRRAIALWTLGRYPEALADLRSAVTTLRRAGDTIWAGRALTARALVYLSQGDTRRAERDLGVAERLFARTNQELELAYLIHNRAIVAFRSGDLPTALRFLDQAAQRYATLDVPPPDLSIDRCAVLLAAGLSRDALTQAELALAEFDRIRGQSTKKAELLLAAAGCALAAEQPEVALARAQAARRLFRTQHRDWWQAHAGFLVLRARSAEAAVSVPLLRAASQTAARLDRLGSAEAAQAHLLAGRLALRLGRGQAAEQHLATAARGRWRGPAVSRASGWLAEALQAEAAAEPRRLLHACRSGLDVLDGYQLTLGASELRAQATAAGAELARLAQRQALRSGRPRELLGWSERWRATALAVPPVRPADDPELAADLAAARDLASRINRAQARGLATAALRQQQRRLESTVRARVIRAPGTGGAGHLGARRGLDPAALLAELDGTRLVQIVHIDGALHVLVCGGGRIRRLAAGRADQAARATELARFGLRRLASDWPPGGAESALRILATTGRQLEESLLGEAARQLGDGPVVIVPPGRFHAIPWALLPCLRDRVVSVAPSARAWLRARAAVPPARRRVVLVRGPGLGTDGAEVPALAPMYDDVTVFGGAGANPPAATSQQVLAAIDGAWLAHIAAHGTFRADSPLFSALRLDDGLVTVYEFERLRRAPYRMVLPSCDSGRLAPAGADELLGLVSSMLPLGTAGVVASVAPLNDQASVPLMLDLHQQLSSGATLAESLYGVRRRVSDDPVLLAAAWSLVALGAG
jgi:tetratricopeptide (TPR) repeat protein